MPVGTQVQFLKPFVYSVTLGGTLYNLSVNEVNQPPGLFYGWVDSALATDLVNSGLARLVE